MWIVAEFEAVRHDASQDFLCDTQVMGPQQRLWTPVTAEVTRATPSCSPEDLVVGRPLRFESIFMVPVRYADQLAGVALPDNSTAARTPVLTPI